LVYGKASLQEQIPAFAEQRGYGGQGSKCGKYDPPSPKITASAGKRDDSFKAKISKLSEGCAWLRL
jgi:hypothetical protein